MRSIEVDRSLWVCQIKSLNSIFDAIFVCSESGEVRTVGVFPVCSYIDQRIRLNNQRHIHLAPILFQELCKHVNVALLVFLDAPEAIIVPTLIVKIAGAVFIVITADFTI